MGLSEKLSVLNFERNMNWTKPIKPNGTARQSIFAFKGDVYQGLDALSLSKSEINYAQKIYAYYQDSMAYLSRWILCILTD